LLVFFLLLKRQFICDLINLNRDTYYENVKGAILDKLDQNINQMNAIEELVIVTTTTKNIDREI
jgi:hypothetical protein